MSGWGDGEGGPGTGLHSRGAPGRGGACQRSPHTWAEGCRSGEALPTGRARREAGSGRGEGALRGAQCALSELTAAWPPPPRGSLFHSHLRAQKCPGERGKGQSWVGRRPTCGGLGVLTNLLPPCLCTSRSPCRWLFVRLAPRSEGTSCKRPSLTPPCCPQPFSLPLLSFSSRHRPHLKSAARALLGLGCRSPPLSWEPLENGDQGRRPEKRLHIIETREMHVEELMLS